MKTITQTPNAHAWPRKACPTIDARKRDLIIRIADWTRDREEPAYDVECYVGGIYDWNLSEVFSFDGVKRTKAQAKAAAVAFAQKQISTLL